MKFDQKKKYYVYAWFYKQTGKLFYIGKGTKYRYRSKKRDNSTLVEIINTCDCDSKILKGNLNDENIYYFKTSELQIESEEETEWSIDGEYSGKVKSIKISNLNKYIEYILPNTEENL